MGIELIVVLLLVLAAEFVNGWTDAPNAIVTVVSTKVLPTRLAIVMAVVLNVLGALSGTAVAFTIGKGIIDSSIVDLKTIGTAMLSLVIWSSLAALFGIPTSESHALIAGLAGAALATAGPKVLLIEGWKKVGIGLIFSSFLGFFVAFLITKTIILLFATKSSRRYQKIFNRLQILSSMWMAYSHGLNDGQKFIGTFAMTLTIGGVLSHFYVPTWVILLCAITMGLGTSWGGWRIIRNIGQRMVELRPWQGFAAESSASATIVLASIFGIPLSTTHCITTAIVGVGAARQPKGVRWRIAGNVVLAWILTFPFCGLLSFLLVHLLKAIT